MTVVLSGRRDGSTHREVAMLASLPPELRLIGGLARGALAALPGPLATVVVDRLAAWFLDDTGRDRTYRVVRRFDEPRLDLDGVADAVRDAVG